MIRAATIVVALAACGPKSTPTRPCIDSQEARAAEGDYAANGGGGYHVHGGRCNQACEAGDEAACVEWALLWNEVYGYHYLTLDTYAVVEKYCADGHTSACEWLADPRVIEEHARLVYESTPYRGERGSGSPVDDAVASISAQASGKGLTLLEQSTYSLAGTSSISFTVDSSAGDGLYLVAVIADQAMPFTASVGSTALSEVHVSDDVHVRMGEVSLAQDSATSISIYAAGSERGDVKFLLFANTGD